MMEGMALYEPEAFGIDPVAITERLAQPGWCVVYSRALQTSVLWYRPGAASIIPQSVAYDLVAYRTDELALCLGMTHAQLKAVHLVKQVFWRSRILPDPGQPIDWHSWFAGVVWDRARGWDSVGRIDEPIPPVPPPAGDPAACPI